MKIQIGIEYFMVYAFSLAVVGYVLSVFNVFGLVLGGSSGGVATPTPSSCYITPQFPCSAMSISSNTLEAQVEFSNTGSTGIKFPGQGFTIMISSAKYTGSCEAVKNSSSSSNAVTYSGYAAPGAEVLCSAYLQGATIARGSQLNPSFSIGYELCPSSTSCMSGLFNTTGTGTVYVS